MVMLESHQPGELPLMKELSALKRARSLRDPSTGLGWKSPVLAGSNALAPISRKAACSGSTGRSKQTRCLPVKEELDYGQSTETNGRSILRRHISSQASPRLAALDGLGDTDEGRIWEAGTDRMVFEDGSARIKGLESWRNPDWPSDIEGHSVKNTMYMRRGNKRQNWSWDLSGRWFCDSENEVEAQKQSLRKQAEAVWIQKKVAQHRKDNDCKYDVQALSPLILNSVDERGHSLSVFSLEGHHHDWHTRVAKFGTKKAVSQTQSPRRLSPRLISPRLLSPCLLSPRLLKHLARSGHRESLRSSWRAPHVLSSSASTSQRTGSQSSIAGMWETASNCLNDELDVCELPKSGCGIPCYWSKSQRRGKSFLDVAGRGLSCGIYSGTPRSMGNPSSRQREIGTDIVSPIGNMNDMDALPLLTDPSVASDDAGCSSGDDTDRSFSDLNGELSLDVGSMSNTTTQTDSQNKAVSGKELAIYVERPRSLSQKYRPKSFEELVGQNLVAHALSNAVYTGKVAPVYLFQGSRGTGKTSAARIFAAALNCINVKGQRPCGVCDDCLTLASGKMSDVREVDAASHNGVEKVKALLEALSSSLSISQFRVFIIEECHMLTSEAWNALLNLLEKPPRNVIFILITTDPDQVPVTANSRCQKFPFPKIKDSDIVTRLQAVAKLENLQIEPGALHLIASRSDGSLRDAENILDQLSLLGQRITNSMVHELVGSVSDEKLLRLLDLALCSDTVSTVQRARELIDSGVEPLDLMAQLATLITDILAGSNVIINKAHDGGFFSKHALSEEELERLRLALRILSDAERQLRAASNDRTTWLTAALLQFGPSKPCTVSVSSSATSAVASPRTQTAPHNQQVVGIIHGRTDQSQASITKGTLYSSPRKTLGSAAESKDRLSRLNHEMPRHPEQQSGMPVVASRQTSVGSSKHIMDSPVLREEHENAATFVGPGNLGSIWRNALERCKSPLVRQLLQSHGKLLAVSISSVDAVVFLEFEHLEFKSKAERSKKSISNAFQTVLGLSVEVKTSLAHVSPANADGTGSISRVWPTVDQGLQGECKQSTHASGNAESPDQTSFGGGSLHWRIQSKAASPRVRALSPIARVASPRIVEQGNSAHSFPAIRSYHHSKGGEVQPPPKTPRGASFLASGGKVLTSASDKEDDALTNAWIQSEGRRTPPLQECKFQIQNRGNVQEIIVEHTLGDKVVAKQLMHANVGLHGCDMIKNPHAYDLEGENLRLESQSKYAGFFCWKVSKPKEGRVTKQQQQEPKKRGMLMRLVPCANR